MTDNAKEKPVVGEVWLQVTSAQAQSGREASAYLTGIGLAGLGWNECTVWVSRLAQ